MLSANESLDKYLNHGYTNKYDNKIFTKLEVSTLTVGGELSNIYMHEETFIDEVWCHGNIVSIDCNFGHKKLINYKHPTMFKKSSRGRKAKPKPISTRKKQGDASSMVSQVTFSLVAYLLRRIPDHIDKYSDSAIRLDERTEYILKEYKIKVFRNGKISIPGVRRLDMADMMPSLNELVEYLSTVVNKEVKIKFLHMSLENYKFKLLKEENMDLRVIRHYFNESITHLYSINFDDIFDYISCPNMFDKSPRKIGWNKCYNSNHKIKWESMWTVMKQSMLPKNIHVNKDELLKDLMSYDFEKYYEKILLTIQRLQFYLIELSNKTISVAIKSYLSKIFYKIMMKYNVSDNNKILSVDYDINKFRGLKLYVRVPSIHNLQKTCTIKFFRKGKINIDTAKNYQSAQSIYYWLNDLFYENNFTFDPKKIYDESDSDFSISEDSMDMD